MRQERFPQTSSTALSPPLALRRSVQPIIDAQSGDEKPCSKKLGGLVLTRHLGESIMIGDEVVIEVVGLKSGTSRLKIVAPRTVAVHRREVFDEIRANPLTPRFGRAETTEDSLQGSPSSKPRGGLVLSRNVMQSIMIGDEVEVTVVEVRPTAIKLKIVAPRSISVHRREVYEAIRDRGI
jgi:carbon storage regulator